MQNDKTQDNAFLVYTVLEDPEGSRMSFRRGRFTFTPYINETEEGARVGMEVWGPDISIGSPGLKCYNGSKMS